jgi:4-carboxymuconolactone decarboxylase
MNLRNLVIPGLLGFTSLLAQDRMPPIPADKQTPAQKEALAGLAASERGAAPTAGPFIVLLRSPELLNRMQKVGEFLRYNSSLPQELTEMTILITARDSTQQYEWTRHYPIAIKAGVKEETAAAIAEGRRPEKMTEDEAIVYDFDAELLRNRSVSDPTYARLLNRFGEAAVVDTVGTVGYYSSLALMMSVARSPVPPSTAPKLAPFPR